MDENQNTYKGTETAREVAKNIFMLSFDGVNAFLVGSEDSNGEWVLIDTGLEGSADFIVQSAQKYFGKDVKPQAIFQEVRPQAIFLTHGHCDHAGSAEKLAELWDVAVYAHPLEIPYITGKKKYPANDFAGGGDLKLSNNVDCGHRAVALTLGSGLPGMPGWKWIHTPGLSEGHISFFRESDRVLIVGDAFSTVRQQNEPQNMRLMEYTSADWKRAEDSLKYLLQLQPSLALPSHGQPMKGGDLHTHMEQLVRRFDERTVPHGMFAD